LSPELQEAIAAADADERDQKPSPAYRRGLFALGPQFVTPSDVLAKLIAAARGKLDEVHYAPSPVELERADRRRMRRKYKAHGRAEFLAQVYG
jgi:hypothetical protein